MTRALEELVRVIAYGGIGMWAGFIGGFLASDRHRLVTTILSESERDVPGRRRFLRGQALQSATVILVMLAMLLTGLTWMRSARSQHEQEQRDCRALAEVSRTLRERTAVYKEQALPERRLWLDLRHQLVANGVKESAPTVQSIDRFLAAQHAYLIHLRNNPYRTAGACD